MFCNQCGSEVSNNSKFCSVCGAQIEQNAVKEMSNEITAGYAERDVVVNHASMDAIGVNNTVFQNRVDSSENKEVNERLFTLYEKLILPVSAMEEKYEEIDLCERDLRNKTIIKVKYWLGFVIMFVLALIVEFIAKMLGLSETWSMSIIDAWLYLFCAPLFLNLFLRCLQPLIDKKRFKQDRIDIENAKVVIDNIKSVIAPYIAFVPPAYRHSDALTHFCNYYRNSQVDTLKEAVNAYEQDCRHRETINTIQESTRRVVKALQDIAAEVSISNQKLDTLDSSIWMSSFVFRW